MRISRFLQYAFIAIVTISVGFSLYQWNASRASTQKTAPNNGLVGYWSFDEGTGTQAGDASGNGNTGTLTNGPTWGTGKLGQALNFDGTDDYVSVAGTQSVQNVSYWVKPSASTYSKYSIGLSGLKRYFLNNGLYSGTNTATRYINAATPSSESLGSELLTNGNFETGDTSSWVAHLQGGATGDISVTSSSPYAGAYSLDFNVTNGATATWHAQVQYTNNLSMNAGALYKIQFAAKGSVAKNGTNITLQQLGAPYAGICQTYTYDVTTSWVVHTFYCYSQFSDSTMRLFFGAGNLGAFHLYIDNVSVKPVNSVGDVTTGAWNFVSVNLDSPVTADNIIMGLGSGLQNGSIDEVRIYNRALSGTEVTNLYNLGAEKLNVSPVSNLTSGLVGYWTFDGKDTPWSSSSAGTATDRSGNSNTGTLTNMSRATSPTIGKLGQALNFDGVNDYIDLGTDPSLRTSVFTYTAWIKPSNGTQRTIISGGNSSPQFRVEPGNNIGLIKQNVINIGTSTMTVQNGVWSHVAVSYDALGSYIFYINGVASGSGTNLQSFVFSASYRIGQGPGPSFEYFIGSIDEVRIYNRALSAGEIQSLYDLGASDKVNSSVSQNQGTGRLDSGLVGYWKLDDASGTTATDSSTNANSGTLTGGPTWGTGKIGGATDFTGQAYVTIPNSTPLQVTGSMTASFWIYLRGHGGGWNPIICKFSTDGSNEFNIRWRVSTEGQFYSGPGGGFMTWDPNADIGFNQWAHVVARRNITAGTMDMWFNGIKKRSGAASGLTDATTQPVQLGAGPNGGTAGRAFDGLLDEVRVYNRAISDEEIAQLYRLNRPSGTDTSLKGYWSFNGSDISGTTAYDRSGSANNGTLTNGPTKTIGKLGQALNFDGVDDWVDTGDMPSIEGQSAVTISAWIKPNALVDWAAVASKYASVNYDLTLNEGGTGVGSNSGFIASIRNGSDAYGYTGSGKLSVGTWSFVSMVFDGTQTGNANRLKIYVNGVNETLTFNGTIPATTISNSQNMLIGRTGAAHNYFNGSLDDVRIYNRALSSTEVSALYNAGR